MKLRPTYKQSSAAPDGVESPDRLLWPPVRSARRTDPFGNPLDVLWIESAAAPRGLRPGRKTAGLVRVECRRDPLDPSRVAYIAPERGKRITPQSAPAPHELHGIPCNCPFEWSRLAQREPTRFRIVPGQESLIEDTLGDTLRFVVKNTTVIGNALPAAPHQFIIISTLDHHKSLHERIPEEVEDLVRVLASLTARARALGARGIEVIKNHGQFAGGTVAHPHWQARVLMEPADALPARRPRTALRMLDLVLRERVLGTRVFLRRRTTHGEIIGWRAFAGFECYLAVLRQGADTPTPHYLCDLTADEYRQLAASLQSVAAYYASCGIEDYNVLVRQPAFVRRPTAKTDTFSFLWMPRGPAYQPAGFEIISGYRVQFVSESPEQEAQRMRAFLRTATAKPARGR